MSSIAFLDTIQYKQSALRFVVAIGCLLFALVARADYDAELDIGLVAEQQTAGTTNSTQLSAALDAGWAGGRFRFRDGHIGPVLEAIHFKGKEFYFAKPILTSKRYGSVPLVGTCGRCWPIASSTSHPLNGTTTRFTLVDGGLSIVRIRNVGQVIENIEVRGRPWIYDPTGEGPIGPKALPQPPKSRAKTGIEVESRGQPPTGLCTIRNCLFTDCDVAIRAMAGYYDDDGRFTNQPVHADNGLVDGCVFFGCGTCFKSENLQVLCWTLRAITIGYWGGASLRPCIVAEVPAGGKLTIDGISANHPQLTLFSLGTPNPNTNRFVCRDFIWDQVPGPANYLKLVTYTGVTSDLPTKKVAVRIDGHINNMEARPRPDLSRLLDVPTGFPTDDITFDMTGMPTAGLERVGSFWKAKAK